MTYRVGITPEGVAPDGSTMYGDIGLARLRDAGIDWEILPRGTEHHLRPEDVVGYDAVIAFTHSRIDADLGSLEPRLRHVARYGAGYDGIDVAGLAESGIVLTNTPAAVRRPLALAGLTLMLNLGHRFEENARAAREGRWTERGTMRGRGFVGKTIGVIGLGSVGSEFVRLALPLGARIISEHRPSAIRVAEELGIELVSREELAASADYVVLAAALTPSSHHLVDAAFLQLMKPTAFIVNIGRGPLIDQAALTSALRDGLLAGAGLDVLEVEPPAADEPLLHMPNAIVTPHALCVTEDFVDAVSDDLIEDLLRGSRGERPRYAVNPGVFEAWRGDTARSEVSE
ncbi:2-hydroxyacid dehydrogenase [Microbacterium sp. NPDC089696]|uniref:2-hydroxyacid dehydrogenase n=1 Tax=Microbacterium sp. NPDC089696 TaxID=3364199 RepID=UPI003826DAB2